MATRALFAICPLAQVLRTERVQLPAKMRNSTPDGSEPFLEKKQMRTHLSLATAMGVLIAGSIIVASRPTFAADEEAARELARQNNCFKCHAIKKDKDGPAWSKVAEKYKGKPDAEAKLIHHITSGEMAKFPDGHEEKHKIVQTDPPHNEAQIKNLVDWILSL
jgi:cytochrome c